MARRTCSTASAWRWRTRAVPRWWGPTASASRPCWPSWPARNGPTAVASNGRAACVSAICRRKGGARRPPPPGGPRRALAGLLLEDPGLLLLDEPTNHLDLDAIEWLEAWLRDWPGAALVVSHDRTFLDRVAGAVWELTPQGLSVYPGNYSAYLRQSTERRLEHARRYQAQQEHLEREQDYIRRNIAGQNTRQAKGRRKRLERWLQDEALDRPGEAGRPRRRPGGGVGP